MFDTPFDTRSTRGSTGSLDPVGVVGEARVGVQDELERPRVVPQRGEIANPRRRSGALTVPDDYVANTITSVAELMDADYPTDTLDVLVKSERSRGQYSRYRRRHRELSHRVDRGVNVLATLRSEPSRLRSPTVAGPGRRRAGYDRRVSGQR